METILITGAGTGLGKALALTYSKKGFSILLSGRNEHPLKTVEQEIEQLGGHAAAVVCDITNSHSIAAMLNALQEKNITIDRLINNAGVGYFGELESLSEADINTILDTNVKGTILLTRALLPLFKKQQSGRILNIISTAGLRGKVNESVYVASKFAVRGFSESLQKELEHTPIDVTAVYMGGMDTPFWENSDHVKDKSRFKTPETVAEKILSEDDGRPEIFVDK
ncbi:SDR family NAD(P)-dependent oxidoreductase [Bacillus taeanensis]|nr:SDR family oxidoreductase [Bacillus taeanensis]